jgi:hypothetical protein
MKPREELTQILGNVKKTEEGHDGRGPTVKIGYFFSENTVFTSFPGGGIYLRMTVIKHP